MTRSRHQTGGTIVLLAFTIALGLASRLYRPVLPDVIAEYAGDTLWATAVFFMLRLVRPAASGLLLAGVTLAIAFSVEFSQLAHAPWLDAFRQRPGVALVLGYDFVHDRSGLLRGRGRAGIWDRRPADTAPSLPPEAGWRRLRTQTQRFRPRSEFRYYP